MAVVAVDGWWVYCLTSCELGSYETEEEAIAAASSTLYGPDSRNAVIPCKIYKLVPEETP